MFLCVCVWEWHLTHYRQSANPLKVYNADGCHLRNQIWDLLKSISAKEKTFVLALLLNRSSQKRQIKYPLLSNCCLSFFVMAQVHITTKAVMLSSLGTQQTLENYLKCYVLASSALTVKSVQSPFRKCFFSFCSEQSLTKQKNLVNLRSVWALGLVNKISTPSNSLSMCVCLSHTLRRSDTLSSFLYDFPQAAGTECKSRQNSSSSTIHLSTGLLGRKKEERERVSINHLTPGYIYAHSNEFNKESSPWSNILSGTSSLSPSSTPSSLYYPPLHHRHHFLLLIPQEASDCEVAEDASVGSAQTEKKKTGLDTRPLSLS